MSESYCVILSTAGSREEAARLAEILVARKLAACVQATEITSTFFWEGKLNQAPEFLLLIKTASRLYKDVEAAIVENHSYQVPELVQLRVERGLERYLGWIAANTKPAAHG